MFLMLILSVIVNLLKGEGAGQQKFKDDIINKYLVITHLTITTQRNPIYLEILEELKMRVFSLFCLLWFSHSIPPTPEEDSGLNKPKMS